MSLATYPGEKAAYTTATDINVIEAGQVIPDTNIQPEMATKYTSKVSGSLKNRPQQTLQLGLWEELCKREIKTLGAVQIIIGLIHIGFGGISAVLWNSDYTPLATYGAYPFWGGLFFIASGSLSVSAGKHPNTCLVECSLGMNIASAVVALTGAILYISELITNLLALDYNLTESLGYGLGLLLLLFSLLEFCITACTAHFGCRATCCKNDMTILIVPCTLIGDGMVSAEDTTANTNLSPPAHNRVASTYVNESFCP